MATPSTPPLQGDLRNTIHGLSWNWLSALIRGLEIGVDLIDDRGAFCSVATSSGVAGRTLHRLAGVAHDPALQQAIQSTFRTGKAARVSIDSLDIGLFPVKLDRSAALLALVRDLQPAASKSVVDLELIGHALGRAVEAHALEADDAEAFDRVSSLHRLLHEAVDRGSENDVVTAFAEAVFAWDGIEVTGYIYDLDGQLSLSVSAPGARRGRDLVEFTATAAHAKLAPLSRDDAERFGFESGRRLLATEVRSVALEPWFLVFAEGFGSLNESRTALYVDLLREALRRVSAIVETRTAWAVLQPLLGAGEPEAAAAAALTELARAFPALGGALIVTAANGAVVLTVGDDDQQSSVRPFGRVRRLVSTAQVAEGYRADLSVLRASGLSFTRREQQLLDRAMGVLSTWLARIVNQGALQSERRAERRDFDQVLDRAAAQALRDGSDVGIVVIAVPEIANRSGVNASWVVELRGRLRAADLAGALSDREIGMLLLGIGANDVTKVGTRICQQTLKSQFSGSDRLSLGFAARSGGSKIDGSLVNEARKDAARQKKRITEERG